MSAKEEAMSIQGRTERTVKEDPTKPGHTCSHGGLRYQSENDGYETTYHEVSCGIDGWLCDMCKADRADARADRLVEGLALAGMLSRPDGLDPRLAENREQVAFLAVNQAAVLREQREGAGR